jgi:hypothetical protein
MQIVSLITAVLALVVAFCSFIFRKPGPQGPVGPMGPRGIAGEDGHDGDNGKDGKDGADGKPGEIQIVLAKDLTEDEIKALLKLVPGAKIAANGNLTFSGIITAKKFVQSESK